MDFTQNIDNKGFDYSCVVHMKVGSHCPSENIGLLSLLPKKNFLHDITLRNQLSIISTDFLHMFTFLKLSGSWRKKFFVKSDFFPKIANFCRKGLPLSKTYWMIVSPQKRVKKMPTICTCQTFIYYVNRLKTNFEVIFKAHFRAKKISKIIMGP